eukprot:4559585-Prymnesium_polylepis.1
MELPSGIAKADSPTDESRKAKNGFDRAQFILKKNGSSHSQKNPWRTASKHAQSHQPTTGHLDKLAASTGILSRPQIYEITIAKFDPL